MALRQKINPEKYKELAMRECFICNIVKSGERRAEHPILYEDDRFIAFLNNFPTYEGQTLVCPKEHAVDIFRDLKQKDYSDLLQVARRVGHAIDRVYQPERMYLVSFGSVEMNDHIHLHLLPLPPGVPLSKQQCSAMSYDKNDVIKFTPAEKEKIARRIREQLGP